MVAILVYPDAAFPYMELYMKTYMEAYMEAYTDGAFARMDTALLQVDVARGMQKCKSAPHLCLTGGAASSHDNRSHDLHDIGFPIDGEKVFLTRDANRDSAKNRFLESSPEADGMDVIVLVDDADEFLVLMDEIRTPKREPGAHVTWDDEDSKRQ
jgi:hypothetical protein